MKKLTSIMVVIGSLLVLSGQAFARQGVAPIPYDAEDIETIHLCYSDAPTLIYADSQGIEKTLELLNLTDNLKQIPIRTENPDSNIMTFENYRREWVDLVNVGLRFVYFRTFYIKDFQSKKMILYVAVQKKGESNPCVSGNALPKKTIRVRFEEDIPLTLTLTKVTLQPAEILELERIENNDGAENQDIEQEDEVLMGPEDDLNTGDTTGNNVNEAQSSAGGCSLQNTLSNNSCWNLIPFGLIGLLTLVRRRKTFV